MRFGGEIGIKGEWTRRAYEKLLLKNIKKTLNYHGVQYEEIVHKRGRIYIKTLEAQKICSVLTQIIGVSSVSPAAETTSDKDGVIKTAVELAAGTIKSGSSFAVRCRRVGRHSYSSMDICREVGSRILADLKDRKLRVDLDDPQYTTNVEVRDDKAYVFLETMNGVGGFPVGSQARVVCLLSGGIDSPVASWLVMKRGCPIIPVYFDNSPLTDEAATFKALEIAKRLFEWSVGYSRRVYVVPHGKNLSTFMSEAPRKLTCLLCKRMMYRIAERIAEEEGAEGIVTGEAIGEQASQTIVNLRVLDEAATRYPVHRPLLGFDKTETTMLARKIGTFEISTQKARGCTAAPDEPATKAKLEIVKNAEEEVDIEKMVDESLRSAKIVTV